MRKKSAFPNHVKSTKSARLPNDGSPVKGGASRRRFIEMTAATVAAAAGIGQRTLGAEPGFGGSKHAGSTSADAKNGGSKNGIPYRVLGGTGEKVSMVGLGGFHIGMQADTQESIRIVRTAIDEGINFLDNCWDYNDGQSELRMGQALRDGYREKAFLMTKIDGREKALAAKQIHESLQRLQTDRIDLLQFHEIIRDSDVDRVFAAAGALEAALQAKQAGKVRYIGFTGHKSPDFHLKMLAAAAQHKFMFDTVQMPLNVMDAHINSFEKRVLPRLVEEKIGVLGMKPMAGSFILKSKTATATECLHYAMNLPTSVVITGCDSLAILQQALEAARGFQSMSAEQVSTLLAKTSKAAQLGEYELYKTSHQFDGTYQNPQWLG